MFLTIKDVLQTSTHFASAHSYVASLSFYLRDIMYEKLYVDCFSQTEPF
jgi:hypothetical protein